MLTQITEQLWYAEDDLFMPGRIHFRCRMTIIRLADDRLLLYSPIKIDDGLAQEIEKLGQVTWLVGPNGFHHLFLRDGLARWPDAELWGAPSLARKRKRLLFTGLLNGELPQAWQQDLETQLIQGMPAVTEVVFFHKPSKTLIVTDLVFNIQDFKNKRTSLLLRLAGAHKKVAQSRLWRFGVKNREAGGASLATIFGWDFQRVVMAHGIIIEDDARNRLKKALSWMLKDQTLPGG